MWRQFGQRLYFWLLRNRTRNTTVFTLHKCVSVCNHSFSTTATRRSERATLWSVGMFYYRENIAQVAGRNALAHPVTWHCGELIRRIYVCILEGNRWPTHPPFSLCPSISSPVSSPNQRRHADNDHPWRLQILDKEYIYNKVLFALTQCVLNAAPTVVKRRYGNKDLSNRVPVCGVCSCRWSPVIAELVAMRMSGKKTTRTSQYRRAICPNMFLWATESSAGVGGAALASCRGVSRSRTTQDVQPSCQNRATSQVGLTSAT